MTSEELVSKKDFKQAKKRGPVLLDFYTVWSGPCKVQAQLLKEHGDKIKERFPGLQIYSVDITNKKDGSNQFLWNLPIK